jgi:hypothetical protein
MRVCVYNTDGYKAFQSGGYVTIVSPTSGEVMTVRLGNRPKLSSALLDELVTRAEVYDEKKKTRKPGQSLSP